VPRNSANPTICGWVIGENFQPVFRRRYIVLDFIRRGWATYAKLGKDTRQSSLPMYVLDFRHVASFWNTSPHIIMHYYAGALPS